MAKSKNKKVKNSRNSRETLSSAQLNAPVVRVAVRQTPRNPLAFNPLMRKGGAHQRSKSAERSQARRELQKLARDILIPAL